MDERHPRGSKESADMVSVRKGTSRAFLSLNSVTRMCVSLLGVASLYAAWVPAASGQGSAPEIPDSSMPSRTPQNDLENPVKEPDAVPDKRRTLVGPQPVTSEQREEAE